MHELEPVAFEKQSRLVSPRRQTFARRSMFFVRFANRASRRTWQWICDNKPFPQAGGAVSIPHYDEWTIDRWRLEPRLHGLEIDDPPDSEVAPPLWKDLTLALAIAAG